MELSAVFDDQSLSFNLQQIQKIFPELKKELPFKAAAKPLKRRGKKLGLPELVEKYRGVPLRICNYRNIRNRDNLRVFFPARGSYPFKTTGLKKIHPYHPLLFFGQATQCPKDGAELKAHIERILKNEPAPGQVFYLEAKERKKQLESLKGTHTYTSQVLAAGKHFEIYAPDGQRLCRRKTDEPSKTLKVLARKASDFTEYSESLRETVQQAKANIGVLCPGTATYSEFQLLGVGEDVGTAVRAYEGRSTLSKQWQIETLYAFPSYAALQQRSCADLKNHSGDALLNKLESKLGAILQPDVRVNFAEEKRRSGSVHGFKDVIRIVEVCPGGALAAAGLKPETMISGFSMGYFSMPIEHPTTSTLQRLFNTMTEQKLIQTKGLLGLALLSEQQHWTHYADARLPIDTQLQASNIASKNERKKIIRQTLSVINPHVAKIDLRALQKPIYKKPGVSSELIQKIEPFKPFGTVELSPEVYGFTGFVSGGQRFSVDDVIYVFNSAHQSGAIARWQGEERAGNAAVLSDNSSVLVFSDDAGKVYFAGIAHRDSLQPERYRPQFTIRELSAEQIQALKTIVLPKWSQGGTYLFDPATRQYQSFLDIMRRLGPAMQLVYQLPLNCLSYWQCSAPLKVLKNEVPTLAGLVQQSLSKTEYYSNIVGYSGRADAVLVPLASLAPLPAMQSAPEFLASDLFLDDEDYFHQAYVAGKRYEHARAKKYGYVYKNPEFWPPSDDIFVRSFFDGEFGKGQPSDKVFDTVRQYFNLKYQRCRASYKNMQGPYSIVTTETSTDDLGYSQTREVEREEVYLDGRFYARFVALGDRYFERSNASGGEVLGNVLNIIRNPNDNILANAASYALGVAETGERLSWFFNKVGCNSAPMAQLEENLYRRLHGETSLQDAGVAIPGAASASNSLESLSKVDTVYKSCRKASEYKDYAECICYQNLVSDKVQSGQLGKEQERQVIDDFKKLKREKWLTQQERQRCG